MSNSHFLTIGAGDRQLAVEEGKGEEVFLPQDVVGSTTNAVGEESGPTGQEGTQMVPEEGKEGRRPAKRERTEEMSGEPDGTLPRFAPPKKVARTGEKPTEKAVVETRPKSENPSWYAPASSLRNKSRSETIFLRNLPQLHTTMLKAIHQREPVPPIIIQIRQHLLKMSVTETTAAAIQQSSLLTDSTFPRIYEPDILEEYHYPVDIRDLAEDLHYRWFRGDIDQHLLRGITANKGKTAKQHAFRSYTLDLTYPFIVPCNYVGQGKLYNGQWFPLQICAKRDGAHGETEAGIHGQQGKGAYSIVVSGAGGYANIDNGDTLEYCGTPGAKDHPSASTKLLLTSFEKQQPIRVLRSASKGAIGPVVGLRYDGLYVIEGVEVLDPVTEMRRFRMVRVDGQSPVRWRGESKRPAQVEMEAYAKIRALLEGKGEK